MSDTFQPAMISDKELLQLFTIAGVQGYDDGQLANELGLSEATVKLLRLAAFTGTLVAPWMYHNILSWLDTKKPLLTAINNGLGN